MRKYDHVKVFSKWVYEQVPTPLFSFPLEEVRRPDTPKPEAKRIDEQTMERLTTSALHLHGLERSRDLSRYNVKDLPIKKTARPLRDYAIFALLKGSGLHIQEVANLNAGQVGKQILMKVKKKVL